MLKAQPFGAKSPLRPMAANEMKGIPCDGGQRQVFSQKTDANMRSEKGWS